MKPPPRPPSPPAPALRPGQLLLVYTPDGPLGGTFTCAGCAAQAWQPELLEHGADCPALPSRPPGPGEPSTR